MVEAAKAGLDKQRWLDEQMGRGFVHYPMQVGEPERSGRRDYDDGRAGDAAKYDDAHADDDDHGGDDDENNHVGLLGRQYILMASTVLN